MEWIQPLTKKASERKRQGAKVTWGLFLFISLSIAGMFFVKTASAAQIGESNLSIYGYLTQAYANSSGGQILGIPQDGTTDYRTAALMFRYKMTAKDTFVLQLNHERLGESPLADDHTVEMDWLYYQHQLSDSVIIKIGKIPIPNGIYNEVMDAGTVLPFYRPASQFYGEVAFSSETVDGGVIAHSLPLGAWELQTEIYAGEWDFVYVIDGVVTPVRSKSALGAQLWLQTPIEGLRLGLGGNHTVDHDVPTVPPGHKQSQKDLHASLDADFEHFLFQVEYRKSDSKYHDFQDYYALAGARLGKFQFNVMAEIATLDLPTVVVPGLNFMDLKLHRDYAVGVNYKFRPDLVLKVEGHQVKTLNTEEPIVPLFMDPIKVKYYIVSLSTSF
ncbi:MAG: hypothetical protein MCM46_01470 [Candidatus Manganitrophus sp. SB1]|nr:hypothetical protein [Candidatus Manganitrophus morganii]